MSSCNYSSFASKLLSGYTPDKEQAHPSQAKCFRQTQLIHAKATMATMPTLLTRTASLSSLTFNTDLNSIYDRLSQKLSESFAPHLDISALETKVNNTSTKINMIRDQFDTQLAAVTSSVQTLTAKVDMQYNEASL
jgi:hypothetical protein